MYNNNRPSNVKDGDIVLIDEGKTEGLLWQAEILQKRLQAKIITYAHVRPD